LADESQQHADANRQLKSQNRATVVLGALITAGIGLLGWMASTLYDMNGTLASMSQQVGQVLEVQQRQQEEIDGNASNIRDNEEAIRRNADRIQQNQRALGQKPQPHPQPRDRQEGQVR
jgi:uncharacterized protein HemX